MAAHSGGKVLDLHYLLSAFSLRRVSREPISAPAVKAEGPYIDDSTLAHK